MCDTMVATPEITGGGMLFAKNSDREADEAQAVEIHEAGDHAPGSTVRCTYIEVPQAPHTFRVLLCRPYWMWGAEMGVNEHGLAIGNEAVFTRARVQEIGLLGMDLLRLTLERADSAARGVTVLTSLLEEHGQGGAAGHRNKGMRYDNSFLLADPEEAWVVETAGRAWVAKRVHGVRSISNALTIGDDWDRAAAGVEARARDMGLSPGKGRVDFTRTFARPLMGVATAARARRSYTQAFLSERGGGIAPARMMAALRRHGARDDPRLAAGALRLTVCAHASWLPTRTAGQTTGSLVCRLDEHPVGFATATSAACTSVFKPVWVDAGLPRLGPSPQGRFDANTLWWRHELLHRRALASLPSFLDGFAAERDALEQSLTREAEALAAASVEERAGLTAKAFAAAEELEAPWLDRLEAAPLPGLLYRRHWRRLDAATGTSQALPREGRRPETTSG